MKAAIVTAPGKTPVYGEFPAPEAKPGEEIISVRAAALSNLTKARASGTHYSSAGIFPAVAGTDGVGVMKDGRRFYFAMPEAPYGSLAELCPVQLRRCVEIPDSLDDVSAAALANPGMSAWGSLVERAHFVAGETVLVNGATGAAGRVAVQLARHLGAARVIATGRNAALLEEVKQLGADTVIPFEAGYEEVLAQTFGGGIDVVIDYLWGESAKTIILVLAKTVGDRGVRFVQVGSAAGEPEIALPGAAFRSSAITLMGSGIGSLSRRVLAESIGKVFALAEPAGLKVATRVAPLSQVEELWATAGGYPRVVFSVETN